MAAWFLLRSGRYLVSPALIHTDIPTKRGDAQKKLRPLIRLAYFSVAVARRHIFNFYVGPEIGRTGWAASAP